MQSSVEVAGIRVPAMVLKGAVVAIGVALITLSAKVQVPFWPVPMTLHTLAVLGIAVVAGPRLATVIFLSYLAAGAVGLPVFSGTPERGIGLAYMAGPTGGYLIGFLVASWLTGWLARGRGFIGRTLAMLAGLTVVYAGGLAWLAWYVPVDQVLALGLAPFILGDLLKVAILAVGSVFMPTRFLGSPVK